jgi:hypothetical protein
MVALGQWIRNVDNGTLPIGRGRHFLNDETTETSVLCGATW